MTVEEKRKEAIAYMHKMASFNWIPTENMDLRDIDGKLFYDKGVMYTGLPYRTDVKFKAAMKDKWDPPYRIETAVNYEQFMDFVDEKHNYTGPYTRSGFIGNNCTSSIYCAWKHIGSVTNFTYSANMMPRCRLGIVPVGDYVWTDDMMTTKEIRNVNTPNKFFECYALLKPADAVLTCFGVAGHARMVVENHPVRFENGMINADESYLITIEQTCAFDPDSLYKTTWRVFKKYTYETLYNGKYIPLTIPEFA